jgi:hypothetical protein
MTVLKSDVAAASNGGIIGPIEDTDTWATHFTSRGWSTPQDQISAGYPVFIQPAQTADGYYEEDWDYGSVLASVRITADVTWETVAGSPTVQVDISYKQNSGDGWTTTNNTTQLFAANVRYVKVRVNLLAGAGADIARIKKLDVKLDAQLRDDAGTLACVSSDSGGTTGTFAVAFGKVAAITVTPLGTADRRAVVDFAGGLNPTTFKVLLFDSAGARVSGDVSWAARGY